MNQNKHAEQNIEIDGATVFDFAIFYGNLFYCVCYFFTFLLLSFKIKIILLVGMHLRTCKCHYAICFHSVVVIMFALHAKGPQFEAGC